SEGASLRDCVRIVVYVNDMARFRPLVNKGQEELWGKGPYPPRTIVEVHRLNQDDICEVEGTFYAPVKKARPRGSRPLGRPLHLATYSSRGAAQTCAGAGT